MLFVNKIKNFINTKKIISEEEFKLSISKGFRYEVSKNKLIFCPGIRMLDDSKNDQARSASPALALQNGANACIMGRSLLQGDVNKNLEKVLNSIK